MDNAKLFTDIFWEAHATKILAAEILKGDIPLKKITKRIEKHMENLMAVCPYRETDNEKPETD